jgi:hypothetical protein
MENVVIAWEKEAILVQWARVVLIRNACLLDKAINQQSLNLDCLGIH